jgi:hypothetical protein
MKTATAKVTTKSGIQKIKYTSDNWGKNYKEVDPEVNGLVWRDAGVDLEL